MASALVNVWKVQEAATGNSIAVQGPSFEGGGGGKVAQIPKVPLLLLPFSQTLTQIVSPGVKLPTVSLGIFALVLLLSSQLINVSTAVQALPLYNAIPASVIVPTCVSKIKAPIEGTTTLNQTSPPKYPAQPGSISFAVAVADSFVNV